MCFRPGAEETPQIAREAVKIGAKVIWLLISVLSPKKAQQIAEAAGLTVIMNQCMGAMHGALGLGPGPRAPMNIWTRRKEITLFRIC